MQPEWGEIEELDFRQMTSEFREANTQERLEMNEFIEYTEAQPEAAVQLSEGGFDIEGRFIPGKVEEINAEAAEFDPELQALSTELDSWIQQGEKMSCAVAAQTMAVNQLENGNYTEQQLIDIGEQNGWYNEGTYPADVGKIDEYLGMDVEQHRQVSASELSIANDPEIKVLACVDSTLLLYPDSFKRCQPDHVVQVLRVDHTSQGAIVILNDPGYEGGRGVVYPMEIFEKAYKGDITTIRKGELT